MKTTIIATAIAATCAVLALVGTSSPPERAAAPASVVVVSAATANAVAATAAASASSAIAAPVAPSPARPVQAQTPDPPPPSDYLNRSAPPDAANGGIDGDTLVYAAANPGVIVP